MNATITGNTLRQPAGGCANSFAGLDIDIGNPQDTVVANILISGNTLNGSSVSPPTCALADVVIGDGTGSAIHLSKGSSTATTADQVVKDLNPTGPPTVDSSNVTGTLTLVSSNPPQ